MKDNALPSYRLKEVPEGSGRFCIINDKSLPMSKPGGDMFPHYPKALAEIILADINEILGYDAYLDEGDPDKSMKPEEVSKNVQFENIRKQQQMMSCCISMEAMLSSEEREGDQVFELQVEEVLQWDLLFRMSSDPHAKSEQCGACSEAIRWLGSDWKDLPANNACDLEGMRNEDVPFVEQSVAKRFQKEVNEMTGLEKRATVYLFHYLEKTSISLPILWVKGYISCETIKNAYLSFTFQSMQTDPETLDRGFGSFLYGRLSYFRKYLQQKKTE